MSVLTWIQTFLHPDSFRKEFFFVKKDEKKVSRRQQKHGNLPSMPRVNNYCRRLQVKQMESLMTNIGTYGNKVHSTHDNSSSRYQTLCFVVTCLSKKKIAGKASIIVSKILKKNENRCKQTRASLP